LTLHQISGATPLSALDAVSFDSETTGLDPAKARIIELGAIAIRKGQPVQDETFATLVRPSAAISAASSAVHGITDAMVEGAPSFSRAFPQFQAFAAGRLLVGHSIGFDLALLAAEAERAGLGFAKPRSLCVRMLAMVALGEMPDHSLEMIAARLGVKIGERHRALGDAVTAAAVFAGLVPVLEKRGIKTLAEAERALAGLKSELERHSQAGWQEPVQRPEDRAMPRGDPFAYRHRLRDIMSAPPVCVTEAAILKDVIDLMTTRKISSAFVSTDGKPGGAMERYGILTERDVMRALAARGSAALNEPVGPLAARPLKSIREDAFVYRAIGRMARLKFRHLAVRSDTGLLRGIVSARDLLKLRASAQFQLDDRIEDATSASELAQAWGAVPAMVESLVNEDIPARTVAAVISEEIRAITRAAARLAESELLGEGFGPPPCPYCVLVLGSGGRGESLLKPDQDNAILFGPAAGEVEADRWFETFGARMNAILNQAGIPFCDGGVMAKNAQWRGTPEIWRTRVSNWITRASPEDILNADIFYDFLPVHGDISLGLELFEISYRAAEGKVGFAKALAAGLENVTAPLTLFGAVRLTDGRIDLKLHGLFPIVAFARAAAVRHGIATRSTADRLQMLAARKLVPESEIATLDRAHEFIISLLLAQQRRDIMAGLKPSSKVDPATLTPRQKARLKQTLKELDAVATLAREVMF
jgi:CBS domain-containing protein